MPLISRFLYIGVAVLWWIINTNNFILSAGDANRINLPVDLYLGLPIVVLLLYAFLPNLVTWWLTIGILVIGWGLHVYKTIIFAYAHMNVKTDIMTTVIQIGVYLLLICIGLLLLYLGGPYITKKYHTANKNI